MSRLLPLAPAILAALLAGGAASRGESRDEFFIVSSVDAGKGVMVLKRPTEVTVSMRVSPRTTYRSEKGKAIQLTDLRAGDTVFVASAADASGALTAVSVRQGIMTVPELRRRYFAGSGSP